MDCVEAPPPESAKNLFALLDKVLLTGLSPLFVLQPASTTFPRRLWEFAYAGCKLVLKLTKACSYLVWRKRRT